MASGGDEDLSKEEKARVLADFCKQASAAEVRENFDQISHMLSGRSPSKGHKPSPVSFARVREVKRGPIVDADGCEHYEGVGEGLWHVPALHRHLTPVRGQNTADDSISEGSLPMLFAGASPVSGKWPWRRFGEPSPRALPPRGVRRPPRRVQPKSPEGGPDGLPRGTPDEGIELAGLSLEERLDRQLNFEG
ncbi:hypothetical protein V5799_033696 [Amblyomma americanum]|uniref:Uncharacterized protein n=1 Tax=Amblyomma americanum TaxID=6943 RepID=A0AAQ4DMK3_AMBAM